MMALLLMRLSARHSGRMPNLGRIKCSAAIIAPTGAMMMLKYAIKSSQRRNINGKQAMMVVIAPKNTVICTKPIRHTPSNANVARYRLGTAVVMDASTTAVTPATPSTGTTTPPISRLPIGTPISSALVAPSIPAPTHATK